MRSHEDPPATGDLSAVGLFPLPNVVLFPTMLLPLHVFEPRYRSLVRDVIQRDALLAVPRLRPGYEAAYHDHPAIFDTIGVGKIVEHRKSSDGRYQILVHGVGRTRLVEEHPVQQYRTARLQWVRVEESAQESTVTALRAELTKLVARLVPHLSDSAKDLVQAMRNAPSANQCADIVAAAFVEELDERQALLEEPRPSERFVRLIPRLHELLNQASPSPPSSDHDLN